MLDRKSTRLTPVYMVHTTVPVLHQSIWSIRPYPSYTSIWFIPPYPSYTSLYGSYVRTRLTPVYMVHTSVPVLHQAIWFIRPYPSYTSLCGSYERYLLVFIYKYIYIYIYIACLHNSLQCVVLFGVQLLVLHCLPFFFTSIYSGEPSSSPEQTSSYLFEYYW